MDRRTFLKAAATAGAVVLTGCQELDPREPTPSPTSTEEPPSSPTPTSREPTPTREPPSPTDPAVTDDSRLTDVAADVSEGDEVSNVLNAIVGGQRLVFPSGRFQWSHEVLVTADDWGIRCQDDTVFEVPEGIGDGNSRKVLATHDRRRTADNVHLENLTFDSPGRAAPSIHIGVRNQGHIDGLRYRMNGPLSNRRHENGVRAYVEDDDGELRIDDYRQFNNGDLGAYGKGDSRIGIWVPPTHEGTITLRNPVLQGFPNNACYVSRQPGTVIIDGGLLINNNVSAIRVSGSVEVRDTTIYIDVDRYLDGPGQIEGPKHNTRGLWGDNRQAGTDGGLVTGVSCILKSYRRSTGLATILENPRMTIRNSQFLLDTDIECVQAIDGEIEIVDCRFDGTSIGSTAGIGDITGTGGEIAPNIEPGAVPVKGRNPAFEWIHTHPQTPDRPTRDCPSLAEYLAGSRLPSSQCGSRLL